MATQQLSATKFSMTTRPPRLVYDAVSCAVVLRVGRRQQVPLLVRLARRPLGGLAQVRDAELDEVRGRERGHERCEEEAHRDWEKR